MSTKSLLRRVAAGGVIVTAALAAMMGSLTTASAAVAPGTLGTLTLSPATGLDTTAGVATTSVGCPDTSDAYYLYVFGPGGFTNGLIATTTTDVNLSHTGSF